jgi:hypothetical protein
VNVERVVRALVVAAASLATAAWLLHDSAEPDPLSMVAPSDFDVLDPRAAESSAHVSETAAVRDDDLVADVRSPPPTGSESVITTVVTGPVEPIPLIEGITLPGGMWNLHTMMELERRDGPWADEMERQFSTYFASKPALARSFGQPNVLCRSRFCEIQAVGYGLGAFDTWSAATEDLRVQPWARDLRGGGIYTIERAPNEQAVVLILMRPGLVRHDRRVELPLTPATE